MSETCRESTKNELDLPKNRASHWDLLPKLVKIRNSPKKPVIKEMENDILIRCSSFKRDGLLQNDMNS